jgi:hypothetical protein
MSIKPQCLRRDEQLTLFLDASNPELFRYSILQISLGSIHAFSPLSKVIFPAPPRLFIATRPAACA